MNEKILKRYQIWLNALKIADENNADGLFINKELITELEEMSGKQDIIEDAFYRNLQFGTGGLRGVLGAGDNRMNVLTVAKATQGLANYLLLKESNSKVAISFDSRKNSKLFSEVAAGVLAANEIAVYLYPELMPTPCLSYAVRSLQCDAGIMITASHNPCIYNGFKVYNKDGCQITTEAAEEITAEIEKLDIFRDLKYRKLTNEKKDENIFLIPSSELTSFISNVRKTSVLSDFEIDRSFPIIYSPLNGTGLIPVLLTLKDSGFINVRVVKEQELPDENFVTCKKPNPELPETMKLSIKYAKSQKSELVLATDPDCDRIGVAVQNQTGEYVLLSGNEIGVLLLDFIINRRIQNKTFPKTPVVIKTIVTTDMAEQIAAKYGIQVKNTLTGFKFIGEQIGLLEKQGRENDFIFGFEESYGYLCGGYVRDKDAVGGALMICEMFAYYRDKGTSLLTRLSELYNEYGYYINSLYTYDFEGKAGFQKMKAIMKRFRHEKKYFSCKKILRMLDYSQGVEDLPTSDVLKFFLEGNSTVVIRPSGTEPKIKVYISTNEKSIELSHELETKLHIEIENTIMMKN